MHPLTETWQINNRVMLFLLEGTADDGLEAALFPRGRTVRDLFAHVHNVRLMWLKSAAPDLLDHLEKLEKDPKSSSEVLATSLTASGEAIATLIERGIEDGKIKGFKPHPTAFVGYLLSHEAHHRGQIEWALRHAGHALTDKTSYGLWEWGTR
jgi:uncharacterized damage-inducible protein DinB